MIIQGDENILELAWPISRISEAVEILARKSGFLKKPMESPIFPENLDITDDEKIGIWIDYTSEKLGIEALAVELPYIELENKISDMGPALLRVNGKESPLFLVLISGARKYARIIAPDLSIKRVSYNAIQMVLSYDFEKPLITKIEQLLKDAGVKKERRPTARLSILREQLATKQITGCWLIRLSPGTNFFRHLSHGTVNKRFVFIILLNFIQQSLMLLGWWLIGKGAFQGYFDSAWLLAWALVVFTTIPFQLVKTWQVSLLSLFAGFLFKKRLLFGTLQLEPEEIRHQGAGQFLGRVMESSAVESIAIGGGFSAITALVEFFMAAWVLAMGTGGWHHAFMLLIWMICTAIICCIYYKNTRQWLVAYRGMTNVLVESMVGHRTRLAQEDFKHWHDKEDQDLDQYLKLSERLDNIGILISGVISKTWMFIGLSGLAYTFIFINLSPAMIAVSLGGVLLASQALNKLTGGAISVISLFNSWEQVGPLFKAAVRARNQSKHSILPSDFSKETDDEVDQPLILARDLTFRYREYSRPVIQDCNLRINKGDRILLEGPSGGGKSTFAALISGLRHQESGLLLLWGFDRQSLGMKAWRKRVVSAPQFHENHILTETFAFNLLMGRRWPPTSGDFQKAEEICYELGLGELIEKMPAGFQQMVGESGWQLSHGEKSRVYIARALLQNADLVVLDESFAALDPKNLQKALTCVLNRAKTIIVIAHP